MKAALVDPRKLARGLSRRNPVGELVSFFAAFAFGAIVQVLLKRFWRATFGHEAPLNPSQPGVNWGEALAWGLATGASAGVVKVVARRGTDVVQRRMA